MDVLDAIRGRRSIRAFKNKDVSNNTVETLVDAARWALQQETFNRGNS